ncbi:hypothetical protein GQX74_005261 [Glossina fuscipes]|nr:hypothetical protein GQX74_005261 [Glossina fuscipes]
MIDGSESDRIFNLQKVLTPLEYVFLAMLIFPEKLTKVFLTFKDGQVGVNFLGYHAQAGLGGGQNQNGLLGGLHASAGTPWGQNAAAGLGGNKAHTERRQLIADTQPNVNSINTNANAQVSANTDFNTHSNANADADANANTNVKTVVRSRKVIQTQPSTTTGVNSNLGISYNAQANGDMVRSALQIPIGILQSLQQSLSGLSASKTVTYVSVALSSLGDLMCTGFPAPFITLSHNGQMSNKIRPLTGIQASTGACES